MTDTTYFALILALVMPFALAWALATDTHCHRTHSSACVAGHWVRSK